MLLLTFGFSGYFFFIFLLSVVKLQFQLFFSSFGHLGWGDRFLVFRLSAGPLVGQSCCLSAFVHKIPSTYHLSGTAP